jgi:hypothetical protein
VPHGVELDGHWWFFSQIGMLIDLVLERKFEPATSPSYREMDGRRAIKTLAAV